MDDIEMRLSNGCHLCRETPLLLSTMKRAKLNQDELTSLNVELNDAAT
jgi:hypothetical protein